MDFSVLIAVYAGDNDVFFNAALESVCINQTLLPSEVILVVDGPVGNELQCVIDLWEANSNVNFLVFHLERNEGLAAALNFGLLQCSFDLVARMDADDISLPNRFSVQLEFMSKNPSIVCCSSSLEIFDENNIRSVRTLPLEHDVISKYARKFNPMHHPSVMFRKEIVLECGGYPEFRTSQDYALWSVMLMSGNKFGNIFDVLVHMRAGEALLKRRSFKYLLGELKVLHFQYQIGFLTLGEFFRNLMMRTFIRLAPISIKRILYRFSSKVKF